MITWIVESFPNLPSGAGHLLPSWENDDDTFEVCSQLRSQVTIFSVISCCRWQSAGRPVYRARPVEKLLCTDLFNSFCFIYTVSCRSRRPRLNTHAQTPAIRIPLTISHTLDSTHTLPQALFMLDAYLRCRTYITVHSRQIAGTVRTHISFDQ